MLDVAIIGAGPYGLSAAAHLGAIEGLDLTVFGEPMTFWEQRMPKGMFLRSPWAASHLSDPRQSLGLEFYARAAGITIPRPIPIERFVEYGKWFQKAAVPSLDRRRVASLTHQRGAFRLRLDDGAEVAARRVVVAAGITTFARSPEEFRGIPRERASHASEHRDLSRFNGQRVGVIGGGQSALESAALLREAGAEVEVLVRNPHVHFLTRSGLLHKTVLRRILYAPTDVGPAGVSRVVALPGMVRLLPRSVKDSWRVRCTRPAGAAWLLPRLEGVVITSGVSVLEARADRGSVILRLSNGSSARFDHVILATGYRVDISRYDFLSPALLSAIRRSNGFPCLDADFETSVPGLHMVGAPAAWTYGPLMQFVAGAPFMARQLARGIRGRAANGRELQEAA